MDVERCDGCHAMKEFCKCFCSICKISFYDRRNPNFEGWRLRLYRQDDRNYVCSRCIKCHICGTNATYKTHIKWTHVFSTFKSRWYCESEKCRLESKNDVIHLERLAKKKNASMFETNAMGRDIRGREIHKNLKEILPLNPLFS